MTNSSDLLSSSLPRIPQAAQDDEKAPLSEGVFLILRSHLVREGLKRMLHGGGFNVTGEASSMDQALAVLQSSRAPQFEFTIINDSLSGDINQLLNVVREALPATRIVILTDDLSAGLIGPDIIAQADGILFSEISAEAMVQSLRLIQLGERVLPSDLILKLLHRSSGDFSQPLDEKLMSAIGGGHQPPSPREREVLRCLLLGYPNKVIARHLGITESTVKVHLKGLLRKIRATNRTQAAIWAMNHGIEAHDGASLGAGGY